MRASVRILFVVCGVLAGIHSVQAAGGLLFYNRFTTGGAAGLRRVNGDGTGDQAIALNLPSALYPTVSRNGRALLVTSPDPGRPFKISQNVYAIDLSTGNFARATSYADEYVQNGVRFEDDLGQFFGNGTISSYKVNLPLHKALSPNGSQVTVMNLFKSGSITLGTPLNADEVQASSGRFPLVDVYNLSDALPAGPYVFLSPQDRDGLNQGGDGLDWHPSLNQVVATVGADIPATGSAGRPSMEGTVVAVFAPDSASPFLRKLTSPSGQVDAFFAGGQAVITATGQHDYAPAISPDGARVAYVRHFLRQDSRFDGAGIKPLPSICAIRIIDYNGANDHEVLRFAEGLWVTKLAWSPDGSQIAFDLAPQMTLNGWNSMLGDPQQSAIHVMNANGTNPHLLAAAPAAYPSWGAGISVTVQPKLKFRQTGTKFELEVNELVPGAAFSVEGTTTWLGWASLGTFTADAATQFITITPNPEASFAAYRVKLL